VTFVAVTLVHAVVSLGVGMLVWLSGAGMAPLFPADRPGLWVVDSLAVAAFFPFLLLRAASLHGMLPENLLGLIAHSFLWTACLYLAWMGSRWVGRGMHSLVAGALVQARGRHGRCRDG
jgi:hypothetical protein